MISLNLLTFSWHVIYQIIALQHELTSHNLQWGTWLASRCKRCSQGFTLPCPDGHVAVHVTVQPDDDWHIIVQMKPPAAPQSTVTPYWMSKGFRIACSGSVTLNICVTFNSKLKSRQETPYHTGALTHLFIYLFLLNSPQQLDDILFFPGTDGKNTENKSDLFRRLVSARKGTNKHINLW